MELSKAHSVKLNDRVLWFDGDSTVPESEITHLLIAGLPTQHIFVEELTDTIKQYNRFVSSEQHIGVKTSLADFNFSWNIPDEYKVLDVDDYILGKLSEECKGYDTHNTFARVRAVRTAKELSMYRTYGLYDLLRVLIYIINTLYASNIIWSVGRGSSVSSYVLYLIGVHDVDSVEYDLKVSDFLRTKN